MFFPLFLFNYLTVILHFVGEVLSWNIFCWFKLFSSWCRTFFLRYALCLPICVIKSLNFDVFCASCVWVCCPWRGRWIVGSRVPLQWDLRNFNWCLVFVSTVFFYWKPSVCGFVCVCVRVRFAYCCCFIFSCLFFW